MKIYELREQADCSDTMGDDLDVVAVDDTNDKTYEVLSVHLEYDEPDGGPRVVIMIAP